MVDPLNDSVPASALCHEARRVAQEVAPLSIYRHSLRAFLLAKSYADREALSFDEEGLFAAAMFHDLGLCHPFRDRSVSFQVASGAALEELLQRYDVSDARIDRLVAAVEQHFLPLPRWSLGAEVGLLQIGAWMDATGLRRGQIRAAYDEAQYALPRDGFQSVFRRHVLGSIGSVRACLGLLAPSLGGATAQPTRRLPPRRIATGDTIRVKPIE